MNWQCPYCERHATLGNENIKRDETLCFKGSSDGTLLLKSLFLVCPNVECRKTTLFISLYRAEHVDGIWRADGDAFLVRSILPGSQAKQMPSYVPAAVVDDYNEACLIAALSPKASATLSRRCLQGILRDYWKVKPGKLVDEIEQVKDKMDPATWDAIDAVRKVGNIGAHMEKDINVIVDVEPTEASLLVGLIETLIDDWYIARYKRAEQLKKIKGLVADKGPKPASA